MDQEIIIIKKGPWTPEEDSTLFNYVNHHGEGHWNFLARSAGLKRTGKSCRLRWLNYLRPNVRRGNITLQEQLLILHLHSRWGNRWAKIAEYLPGRTDNEIKNYWRTRVQKQAKQLNCDVNSQRFRDAMRFLWIPRLLERIRSTSPPENTSHSTPATMSSISTSSESSWWENPNMFIPDVPISGKETSSESSEVLTGSDVDLPISELDGGSGFNVEDFGSGWMDGDGVDSSLENLWTDENMSFLQDQLFD